MSSILTHRGGRPHPSPPPYSIYWSFEVYRLVRTDQLCNAQELPGMYLQIHYTAILLFWKIPSTVKPYGYSLIIFSQIRKAAGQKRESRARPTSFFCMFTDWVCGKLTQDSVLQSYISQVLSSAWKGQGNSLSMYPTPSGSWTRYRAINSFSFDPIYEQMCLMSVFLKTGPIFLQHRPHSVQSISSNTSSWNRCTIESKFGFFNRERCRIFFKISRCFALLRSRMRSYLFTGVSFTWLPVMLWNRKRGQLDHIHVTGDDCNLHMVLYQVFCEKSRVSVIIAKRKIEHTKKKAEPVAASFAFFLHTSCEDYQSPMLSIFILCRESVRFEFILSFILNIIISACLNKSSKQVCSLLVYNSFCKLGWKKQADRAQW